jgi:hypothetical protein
MPSPLGVGIGYTYLCKIETDAEILRGYTASSALLLKLAHVLDTDPDEFLLAAGRVPIGIEFLLVNSQAARTFYRRAVTLGLSDAEWDRLRQEMERMVGEGR